MLADIRHFVRLFIAITSTKFQLSVHAAASLVPRPRPACTILSMRPAFRRSRAGRAWERGYAAAVYSTSQSSVEKLDSIRPPARSSTEHVFSCGDNMKTETAKVGITQNIERKRARFQEKYFKRGITRAVVNENVCEDSHTEHV